MPYPIRRAFLGITEHRLLAFATVGTVATVLVLTGAFALVLLNLSGVLDRWGKDVQISCYLRDKLPDDELFELKASLEELPEVQSVHYVSKEDALRRFGSSIEGMDTILTDLDTNPLPASLEVRLRSEFQDPSHVAEIASRISHPAFDDMDYSQEWVERFHAFLSLLRLSAVVLGSLLLLAAIFLVSNTIRLAVHARRDELAIIQLVGGTRWFARLPFLVEGTVLGAAGAVIALPLLYLLHRYAFVQLQASLGMLLDPDVISFLPTWALLAMLLAGCGVGLLGAWTSALRAGLEDAL